MKPIYLNNEKNIYILHDFLPQTMADNAISLLETKCAFNNFSINNKILCRTGCFEGDHFEDGGTVWLRCPSIEYQNIYKWSTITKYIRDEINNMFNYHTNIAKIQKYEDGKSHINVHSDKILDLDEHTPLFVIRFGATRLCVLVNKLTGESVEVEVKHNSLLVIEYEANLKWKHGIVKDCSITDSSYSIVYRNSVTKRYDNYVYGNRTPFKTKKELDDFMKDVDKKLWTKDQYNQAIVECYKTENNNLPTLDIYKDVIQYSPFAF